MNRALATLLATLLVATLGASADAVPLAQSQTAAGQTGHVVVGIDDTSSHKAFNKTLKRAGGRVVRSFDGAVVVDPRAGLSAEGVAGLFARTSGVRYAQPEQRVHALWVPNDPAYAQQWGLARIGAPAAWDVERGASGVTVAIVDSGVDGTHPDLAGRLDVAGAYDFVQGDTEPQDEYGHGTHVAGIVAANTGNALAVAGVAGGCTLLPLRVLDAGGDGSDAAVAQAVRYAADRGVGVINLSLGSPEPSAVMQEACDYAIALDCVVVAASGNAAASGNWTSGAIQYPAAYGPVVAVGATDRADALAGFSEWGSALDLVAPGVDITSLVPLARGGQAVMSGTSMATAYVSGVAALLRSEHPGWSGFETVARLRESAQDLGAAGADYRFGDGLVRADVALGATPPPPGPDSDDDIPGIAAPSSPILESLDVATDVHDVYRFTLGEGDTLYLRLSAEGLDGCELRLFSGKATTIADSGEIMDSSSGELGFTADGETAGTCYLDVTASGGTGEYRVDWALDLADDSGEYDDDDEDGATPGDEAGQESDEGDAGGGSVSASGATASARWYDQHIWDLDDIRGTGRKDGSAQKSGDLQRGPDSAAAQERREGSGADGGDGDGGGVDPLTLAIAVAVLAFAGLGLWRARASR